jgi:DNA-directed RNA polymerase specialized sigma subunit
MPSEAREERRALERIRKALEKKLGRAPTEEEAKEELGKWKASQFGADRTGPRPRLTKRKETRR